MAERERVSPDSACVTKAREGERKRRISLRGDTETTEENNNKKKKRSRGGRGGAPVSSHANLSGALESRRFPERR